VNILFMVFFSLSVLVISKSFESTLDFKRTHDLKLAMVTYRVKGLTVKKRTRIFRAWFFGVCF
jgi:hypothetical protein